MRGLVCVSVCVCVCVCVFWHNNSKRNRSKLEYIVVYENSLDEFDIDELRQIKVKVPVGLLTFPIYDNTNC